MATKQYQQKSEEIGKKKLELTELEANLGNLKSQLEDQESEVKRLEDEIGTFRIRKERALELFEGLSGEEQKWVYFNRILAKVLSIFNSFRNFSQYKQMYFLELE